MERDGESFQASDLREHRRLVEAARSGGDLRFGEPLLGDFDVFDGSHQSQPIVAAETGVAVGDDQLSVAADCQRQQRARKLQMPQWNV
jgi:hypothetical protein